MPKAMVFLGDLEFRTPVMELLRPVTDLGIDCWWIHGNHDTDDTDLYSNLFETAFSEKNLHGRVADICGYRVAGLGGVFRSSVWFPQFAEDAVCNFANYQDFADRLINSWPTRLRDADMDKRIKQGKLLLHRSSIFPDVVQKLSLSSADLLVCHEAPSCHPHGFKAIDELARCLGSTSVFHGHHHELRHYELSSEQMGFRTFGVGFRGITNLAGECVHPGE